MAKEKPPAFTIDPTNGKLGVSAPAAQGSQNIAESEPPVTTLVAGAEPAITVADYAGVGVAPHECRCATGGSRCDICFDPVAEKITRPDQAQNRDDLIRLLAEHRNKPVETYTPPGPTARQKSQTELEMEAGRKRSEWYAAQAANRPPQEPPKNEGSMTPVYRPGDHVPSMDKGHVDAKAV